MKNSGTVKKSWTDLIPIFIVVTAFGPYIFPSYGLRIEHLVIYSLLLFAIPVFISQRRFVHWPKPLLGMLGIFLGITLWTLVVPNFVNYPTVSFQKYLSSIENYVQPMAIIILVTVFIKYTLYEDFLNYLKYLCWCLIWLLCLNSILASCSIFFDMTNLMQPFVKSCFGDTSVWQLAESMRRHSGIFNQPFESGLTYSLGLFCWGYLNRSSLKVSFISGLVLGILTIGGILSVSKVFIFCGLPLGLFYWNPIVSFKKYLNRRFFLGTITGLCFMLLIFSFWEGQDYFLRLFKIGKGTNLVELYTGGRFGTKNYFVTSKGTTPTLKAYSMITSKFVNVWQKSPWCGFGFGTVSCFDNAFLEFFHQGGLIALLGYLALLVIYLWYSLRGFLKGYEEGRLLLVFFILILICSLGASVLTINRFSTIFWVLATFLFLMLQARQRAEDKIAFDQNSRD